MTQVPDTAGTDPLGSLDEFAELVEIERQAQRRALDSMDTKAGVVIGFAAATSALAERGGPLLLPGVGAAAAVLALLAFLPQPGIRIDPARLCRAYLDQPAKEAPRDRHRSPRPPRRPRGAAALRGAGHRPAAVDPGGLQSPPRRRELVALEARRVHRPAVTPAAASR